MTYFGFIVLRNRTSFIEFNQDPLNNRSTVIPANQKFIYIV